MLYPCWNDDPSAAAAIANASRPFRPCNKDNYLLDPIANQICEIDGDVYSIVNMFNVTRKETYYQKVVTPDRKKIA